MPPAAIEISQEGKTQEYQLKEKRAFGFKTREMDAINESRAYQHQYSGHAHPSSGSRTSTSHNVRNSATRRSRNSSTSTYSSQNSTVSRDREGRSRHARDNLSMSQSRKAYGSQSGVANGNMNVDTAHESNASSSNYHPNYQQTVHTHAHSQSQSQSHANPHTAPPQSNANMGSHFSLSNPNTASLNVKDEISNASEYANNPSSQQASASQQQQRRPAYLLHRDLVIGRGSYGQVCIASRGEAEGHGRGGKRKKFACKCVVLRNDPKYIAKLQEEVNVLRELRGHDNVIRLYDVFCVDNELFIITELGRGGDLFHLLTTHPKHGVTEAYAGKFNPKTKKNSFQNFFIIFRTHLLFLFLFLFIFKILFSQNGGSNVVCRGISSL